MLVLSRKRIESLWIGSDVRITVLRIDRNNVRLGIEAPEGVNIVRDELLTEFQNDQEVDEAGRLDPSAPAGV